KSVHLSLAQSNHKRIKPPNPKILILKFKTPRRVNHDINPIIGIVISIHLCKQHHLVLLLLLLLPSPIPSPATILCGTHPRRPDSDAPVKLPTPPVVYPAPAPVPPVYSLPQYQQAQQLFQRDAQTITPEALESVKAALASSEIEHKAETKKKAIPRKAAGQSWEDPTLADWPENDYRLFCGDLGNEVNDDVLSKAFSRFPSFNMARVVRDKRTGKTKGFGFFSFADPSDLASALKEMNG
ncbi:RNA recognition motif domain, partial [Dillenia turbinata]